MEVFNKLLETIEKGSINNQITITNIDLFVKAWKREAESLQLRKTDVNGSFLYSIDVLEKERNLIKDCLSNWEKENYPEAKKEREQRLKDINNALEKLKQ
jgi:hypothetical protein